MGGGVPLEPAPTLPEESGPTRPPSFRSASRGGPLGRGSPPGPFPPRSRSLSMSEREEEGQCHGTVWGQRPDLLRGPGERLGFCPATDIQLIPPDLPKQGDAQKFIQDPGLQPPARGPKGTDRAHVSP